MDFIFFYAQILSFFEDIYVVFRNLDQLSIILDNKLK